MSVNLLLRESTHASLERVMRERDLSKAAIVRAALHALPPCEPATPDPRRYFRCYLADHEAEALKARAEALGCSISEVAENAIENILLTR